MRKSTLTTAIVLSLATTACTGLGVQTGPTLTSQIRDEQGLGNLWGEPTDRAPSYIAELDSEDRRDVADLWVEAASPPVTDGSDSEPSPRAAQVLDRLTLTHSVFGSSADRSQVLPD